MASGLNIKVDIIRITQRTDDLSGGANTTGSVLYASQAAALSPNRPSQISLEAGLETRGVFDFSTNAAKVNLFERDMIKVVWPLSHQYINQQFRVTGVQYPRRRRNYGGMLHATVERFRESRSRSF